MAIAPHMNYRGRIGPRRQIAMAAIPSASMLQYIVLVALGRLWTPVSFLTVAIRGEADIIVGGQAATVAVHHNVCKLSNATLAHSHGAGIRDVRVGSNFRLS